jgi:DNA adenine methylase
VETSSYPAVRPQQFPLFATRAKPPRIKPFLKWAGGKTYLLPVLRECLPAGFRRYFEPFLGGGAMFFDLRPNQAILSDSNQDLIQCYQTVRDQPEELIQHLGMLKVSEEEYYHIRGLRPETLSEIPRAARFIYLNKTCFNGLFRVNKKGLFNTPFGHYKRVSLVDPENLRNASRLLQTAALHCQDYQTVLELARPGDFIYLDPPYLPVGKYSDFKRYTKEFFYESDHAKLAQLYSRLIENRCFVLLSNSYHARVSSLFVGFNQVTVEVPRFVNCKGTGRGKVKELLISNYPLGVRP